MTDHTDFAPRHLRPIHQAPPDPEPTPPPATRTDLEHIAAWIASLTYGDMKGLAAGILGDQDQAQVIVLADKLHAWSLKTKVQP